MSIRRLFLFSLVAVAILLATGIQTTSLNSNGNSNNSTGLIAGRNVNMVSGTEWPGGDPYLQRQNEPSIAVSTRNPLHLLAGANDYRSIDAYKADELPGYEKESSARDAWLGVFKSYDGGQSWKSTLLPGYWLDPSEESALSPLNGYEAAADPVVRAGTNGLFYYSGITFNRGQRGLGKVFVARFIDNNNKETGAIEYIDTKIIDVGNSGHFIDKPCIVVDIPRVGNEMTTLPNGQTVPCGNVYIVYTSFMGDLAEGDAHSKMMFSMSTDCGETWSKPSQITDSGQPYQAATLAIDPNDGRPYLAYRRFTKDKTDAIMLCWAEKKGKETVEGYWHGKIKFSKPMVLAEIDPYDQPTSEITFRTNDYPTMTIDKDGVIYVAWSQRGLGPNSGPNSDGEGKIVMMTSSDGGQTWVGPALVDGPALSGYEFMPSLTSGAGKVMMLWYDQRYDYCQTGFGDPYIQETHPIRHTIDIRAAEVHSIPDPYFSYETIQVSRYPWVLTFDDPENPRAMQLQYNMPNLPIFGGGTVPFFGDYIDISPSPMFVPEGDGWVYNKDPASSPVYHAVWTDNRDVRPPGPDLPPVPDPGQEGDWQGYVSTENCIPGYEDQTGIRNQNIYTSRITEGILAGSPGNTKPLNINRAFVVFVKNTTDVEKILRLEIDEVNSEGTANFYKAGVSVGPELEVTVLPYSSVSATVMVDESPLNEYATVRINVYDGLDLLTYILLNPDSTNPGIEPHDGWVEGSPHVGSNETRTPHVGSRDVINWDYSVDSPHVGSRDTTSPHVGSNRDWVTPHVGSGDDIRRGSTIHVGDGHIIMSNIINPHVGSDRFPRSIPENSSMTDIVWTVENLGNTTSTYSLSTFPFPEYDPLEIAVQLIVYKVYTTPTALGCELFEQEHHELILSQTSPHVGSGRGSKTASIASESEPEPWYFGATFSIPPKGGEEVTYKVILRYMDMDTTDEFELNPEDQGIFVDPEAPEIIGEAVLDPVNALIITTRAQDLDNGIVGTEYNETLEVEGGYGNATYTWSLGGDAMEWLDSVIPSGGFCYISGTPATAGTYTLIVNVESSDPTVYNRPTLTATKTLSIRIAEPLEITTDSLPDAVLGVPYSATLQATGGTTPYTWSVFSASLPPELSLNSGTGEISGTPTAVGTYSVDFGLTDSSYPNQFKTKSFTIDVVYPLSITTAALKDVYKTGDYLDTLQATGGSFPYTWSVLSGFLPDGLSITAGTNKIEGTASQSAVTSTFTVQVTDSGYPILTDTRSLTITVNDPLDVGVFVATGSTEVARRDHRATLLPNGKVLIVGWSQKAELYDPATGTFSSPGNTHFSHHQHSTATLLLDGRVLIVGGNAAPTSAEIYDPADGTFSPTGSLNHEHAAHSATLLPDGRVLIAAGQYIDGPQTHALAEIYDPFKGQFTMTGSLKEDRELHTATLLPNGKVLITGGTQTTEPGYGITLTLAELYDYTTGNFSLTSGNMHTGRSLHTATLLPDGKVLIAGSGQSAELYDPAQGTFSLTDDMNESRGAPSATLLPNGLVLITGGHGQNTTNSADLYDPVTGSFIIADDMITARQQHTSTLLSDGRVLITGGSYGNVNTSSAELFMQPEFVGLVAYYPFNGNANDASGNGNHGTINGGATFTEDRFGNPNGAINFDGIDVYVELPNESNFDLTELTIVTIVKVPNYSRRNYIIEKGAEFGNYSLMINASTEGNPGKAGYAHRTEAGNWSSKVTNAQVLLDEFINIAVTLDSTTFKSYLNGALERTAIPSPPVLNDENVKIGLGTFISLPVKYFLGVIDEIRIYNRVLSEAEINELYVTLEPSCIENTPDPWGGGDTNIIPANQIWQSFLTNSSAIYKVDVDIKTLNPEYGDDTITMKILSPGDEVLATVSRDVADGFEGWLSFGIPGGLNVTPGTTFKIQIEDTGKLTFSWKYELDSYPDGTASVSGWDFRFRINCR